MIENIVVFIVCWIFGLNAFAQIVKCFKNKEIMDHKQIKNILLRWGLLLILVIVLIYFTLYDYRVAGYLGLGVSLIRILMEPNLK